MPLERNLEAVISGFPPPSTDAVSHTPCICRVQVEQKLKTLLLVYVGPFRRNGVPPHPRAAGRKEEPSVRPPCAPPMSNKVAIDPRVAHVVAPRYAHTYTAAAHTRRSARGFPSA